MIARFRTGILTVDRLNELVDAINALTNLEVHPQANAPARWLQSGTNTVLAFDMTQLGGGSSATPRGFYCEAHGALIRVRYGVIGSCTPTGMNSGDIPIFTIPPTGGSGVIMIAATAGDLGAGLIGAVTAEIQCDFALGTDNSPENVYYLQIGSYNTSGGILVVESDGDGVGYQQFKLCGGLGGEPEWGPA